MRADLHQHLWTDQLLEALSGRESLPFVRRGNGLTVLHCAEEQPYVIDRPAQSPAYRRGLMLQDGIELAVIALSSPVGIERLPREQALELIDAHLEGVAELGDQFAAWGPVALDQPDPDDIDRLLAQGCAGVSIPGGALADRESLESIIPVLERTEALGLPLLVHPGPGRSQRPALRSLTEPLWWPALTGYVAQMQAAWLTFTTAVRRELQELTVVFAMLAGGAPLLSERLEARGGPEVELGEQRTFYDTSSYGPVATEAMARRVGAERLVYGSDRPVVEPVRTPRDRGSQANGAQLLSRVGVT